MLQTKMQLQAINHVVQENPREFIRRAEDRFAGELDAAAHTLHSHSEQCIVLLAGPSASGKTTSAALLAKRMAAYGGKAHIVSLDNFYKERDAAPRFPDGKPDYESVHALDIPEIKRCFTQLIEQGECAFPLFDFAAGGVRSEHRQQICLNPGDVLIVEGLHALNPYITESLPPERLLKLYVSVSSRVYDESGKTVFSKTELRFLRRLVRDYRDRASSVANTMQLWEDVLRGENAYLFPFRGSAQLRMDSMHSYELCVLRAFALPLLQEAAKLPEHAVEAAMLYEQLATVSPIDAELVPKNSLLREFIGGLNLEQ